MATFTYTGTLTDIGLGDLDGWLPEMTVRPKVSAFGPDGLVSDVRVAVALTGDTFSMNLTPSAELTAAATRTPNVLYVIEVGRYELADDLVKIWHGTEAWEFTAVVGGGSIGEMPGVTPESLVPFGFGPPDPDMPGLYYDADTGMMYGQTGGN
ncbi:hypothetical protein [Microbacterium sp. 3J1]|uniref:hypothetical protein n=1 Tax=Microbacterium sp. 3J1 TaxID=861269 RepID=UPI000B0F2F94|nr:hypothetical protein [Microbacterium sp. 3J1]